MATAAKANKTFSVDKKILAEIKRTKGTRSESERVNNLLRFALDLEKRAALHEEAASFYSGEPDDREERLAFQASAIRSWSRD
jgi:hypothetical protein